MGNTHATLTSLFTAIADKIRKKTGSTSEIVADNFPAEIDKILTPTDGSIATKTSSNLSVSGATVTVPAGYYASDASKSVSTVSQATPSITIDTANNRVKATCTQNSGYITTSGTNSSYYPFTKVASKIHTPTNNQQTLFNTGLYYFTGTQYLGASNANPESCSASVYRVDNSRIAIAFSEEIGDRSLVGIVSYIDSNYGDLYYIYFDFYNHSSNAGKRTSTIKFGSIYTGEDNLVAEDAEGSENTIWLDLSACISSISLNGYWCHLWLI